MKCQPVLDALKSVRTEQSHVIMMSPAGVKFDQQKAHEYAGKDHLIILCGHYEGMDYRINSHVNELVSIGDYVLTGGELAAMVISDAVIRLQKGSLAEGSTEEESHENGLLEYPQYTQPADFRGQTVPPVLLSGHHEKIRRWRLKESLRLTLRQRPDLLEGRRLSPEESGLLEEIRAEEGTEAGK
jgi:tRNA (guanine37-N1)-methyltransferase